MSTKDPHIALIDAHEKLHQVKLLVRAAMARVQAKYAAGQKLTIEDRFAINMIKQQAIDSTRRIQDELADELSGHGLPVVEIG